MIPTDPLVEGVDARAHPVGYPSLSFFFLVLPIPLCDSVHDNLQTTGSTLDHSYTPPAILKVETP